MITHFQNLLAYNRWANELLVKSLEGNDIEQGSKLLAHIAAAESAWLSRVTGEANPISGLWPAMPISESWSHLQTSNRGWSKFLDSAPDLDSDIHYQNSQGPQTNRLSDILTHLMNHATHHRAQISSAIRQSGGTPPGLDYIIFARQRLLASV